MRVSAVGFLFQENLKGKKPSRGKNYTCIIHKVNQDGQYNRNIISSPVIKFEKQEVISPETAKSDILSSLLKLEKPRYTQYSLTN